MSQRNAATVNSRTSPPSPGPWIEQLIWTTARARERARAQAGTGGRQSLRQWVDAHHFVADREPIDFSLCRYLGPLYDAIPAVPAKNLDIVVMKAAQAGASTWAMLATLWLLVIRRCQLAYYLPTKDHAMVFSEERFIKLARENPAIYHLFGAGGRPRRPGSMIDEGSRSVRVVGDSVAYFTYMGGLVTTESLPPRRARVRRGPADEPRGERDGRATARRV